MTLNFGKAFKLDMKVYIFSDLEGVTGVVDYDRGDVQKRKKYREYLINDVNAAVAGAFDAGSEAVVVYDGHGKNTVELHKLDPRATLIKKGDDESYLQGLDSSYSHLLLVGFHSMAGAGGLLSHTHSLRVRRVILNGQEIGEIGLAFIYASCYGVKPVFISGDDKAVKEARIYISNIEGVAVKRSISKRFGECLTSQTTYPLIRNAVSNALSRNKLTDVANLPKPPYQMEVVYKKPWIAIPRYLIKGDFHGVRIKDLYTIRYKDEDFLRLMKKFI